MSATRLALDPRCGSGRLPRPGRARGRGVAETAGLEGPRGGTNARWVCHTVTPMSTAATDTRGGCGAPWAGRAGPGLAGLDERGKAAGQPGLGARMWAGPDRDGGGAAPAPGARPGRIGRTRVRLAPRLWPTPGPRQRRGGERRRGGTRRGSKGGGTAAPFQLFPQRRHPWLRLGGVGRRRAGACGGTANGDKLASAGATAVRGGACCARFFVLQTGKNCISQSIKKIG